VILKAICAGVGRVCDRDYILPWYCTIF